MKEILGQLDQTHKWLKKNVTKLKIQTMNNYLRTRISYLSQQIKVALQYYINRITYKKVKDNQPTQTIMRSLNLT